MNKESLDQTGTFFVFGWHHYHLKLRAANFARLLISQAKKPHHFIVNLCNYIVGIGHLIWNKSKERLTCAKFST